MHHLLRARDWQDRPEFTRRRERTLLVLDGLEKVQDDGRRSGMHGHFFDGRLRSLLLDTADGHRRRTPPTDTADGHLGRTPPTDTSDAWLSWSPRGSISTAPLATPLP